MNRSKWQKAFAALAGTLMAGCGGGDAGADGGGGRSTISGIDGSGRAMGSVTRFGSVFVNGIEFATSGATFTLDGQPGTEADVDTGQVVSVTGSIAADGRSGTATSVVVDSAVEGPVESIDLASRSAIVMGQTVRTDALTVFALARQPEALRSVQVGDVVEVSGFRDAQDTILATRMERKAAAAQFKVSGTVRNLDSATNRFTVGALSVDYGSAQLVGLPGGAPAAGTTVVVRGTTLSGATLTAARVEGRTQSESGNRAVVEGLITRIVSTAEFEISGQRVTTAASTRYDNGAASDLAVGRRVTVDGALASGSVAADVVRFTVGTELRVAAPIDSIDAAASRLVVLGITIEADARTLFVDDDSVPVRQFNLGSLAAGDYVEVRGGPGSAANRMLAAFLERDDDDEDDVELRGPVEAMTRPQFTILGVTVVTNAETEFEDGDEDITADEFFARAAGRVVAVESEGQPVNGVLVAEEVEIGGDDDLDD